MTRRALALSAFVNVAIGLGCAGGAGRPPEVVEVGPGAPPPAAPAPRPVVVAAAPAAPAGAPVASPAAASAPGPFDAGASEPFEPAPDLGPVWAATGRVDPSLRHDAQLASARALRAAVERAMGSRSDAGDGRSFFAAGQPLVEQANAAYALAARTADATEEGRVVALSEAADLLARWSIALENAGLGALPRAWHADASLRLSFEDVAQGPSKRWRTEAATLARHCVSAARRRGLASQDAERCRTLDARLARLAKPAPGAADAGAACACDPLDPLCSASLGPWCRGGH